ncbi:uncharacterized protein LOC135843063 [Planococcus citri]|uniref:uncharacterized protein LOC135843063 n=1 Tax=Planococcus citri TaxID=170843 RepID=UPI0031F84DB1
MSANINYNSIGKAFRPWNVHKILDRKLVSGRVRYLVKWKSTFAQVNTWETGESFSDQTVIKNFESQWQKNRRVQARRPVVVRQKTGSTSRRHSLTVRKRIIDVKIKNFKDLMKTEFRCCICFGVYKNPCVTECEHIFCDTCIETWKNERGTCPVCRAVLSRSEKKLIRLDNFIKNVTKIIKKV